MKQLQSFSIETDSIIHLIFQDGSNYRVKKPDLPSLLSAKDLKEVKAAFRKRRKFFTETLPPWARVITIAIIAISVGAGSMRAYSYFIHSVITHHENSPQAAAKPAANNYPVMLGTTTNVKSPTSAAQSQPVPTEVSALQKAPDTSQFATLAKTLASPNPTITLPLGVSVPNPLSVVPTATKQAVTTVKNTLGLLGL